MVGDNSVHRDNSVEKNLAMWAEMLKGTDQGKLCCVRGKLDMQAPNKAMRDPVYYRCNPVPHHRVGTKYKVGECFVSVLKFFLGSCCKEMSFCFLEKLAKWDPVCDRPNVMIYWAERSR
jgi:hypothetical protein